MQKAATTAARRWFMGTAWLSVQMKAAIVKDGTITDKDVDIEATNDVEVHVIRDEANTSGARLRLCGRGWTDPGEHALELATLSACDMNKVALRLNELAEEEEEADLKMTVFAGQIEDGSQGHRLHIQFVFGIADPRRTGPVAKAMTRAIRRALARHDATEPDGWFIPPRHSNWNRFIDTDLAYLQVWFTCRDVHLEPIYEHKNEDAEKWQKQKLPQQLAWARGYCKKEDTQIAEPVEFGDLALLNPPVPRAKAGVNKVGQGRRNDMARFADLVIERGYMEAGLAMPGHYIKYHRGAKELHALKAVREANRVRKLEVVVLWGATGTGKSHRAFMEFERLREEHGHEPHYTLGGNANGNLYAYNYMPSQKNCVFDDFRDSWCKPAVLLRVLDKYPYQINTSGGSQPWNVERIIITTNVHPDYWYLGSTDHPTKAAIRRRLTSIVEIVDQNQQVEYPWNKSNDGCPRPELPPSPPPATAAAVDIDDQLWGIEEIESSASPSPDPPGDEVEDENLRATEILSTLNDNADPEVYYFNRGGGFCEAVSREV